MTIRVAILTALKRVHPNLLPQATLFADVGMILGNPPLPSAIRDAVRDLDDASEIIGVDSPNFGMRWKITDRGRLSLAEI
jgi:hypothetical protein